MRPRSGAVGGSVHAPGVRAYFARPENLPFNFTDPERDEPIVVETWWLPKDVQSRLWRIPINEYGFVRAPSLAALCEKVLVGADETCTFVASDEVVES